MSYNYVWLLLIERVYKSCLYLYCKVGEEMGKRILETISIDLEALIPSFMENTFIEIDALEKAVEDGNCDTAFRMGHNIKGSARNYGFLHLAEIGRKIEIAAADEDMGLVSELLVELKKYVQLVHIEFE